MSEQATTRAMQIFRASEARGLMEEGCMSVAPFTDIQRAGMDKLVEAGYMEGDEIKVLVNIPGFSLTHVWFKDGYPLPLHSHDTDCLYCVIAGSLRLGSEDLGPRDSFFIPADVPYTYRPGPDGVEVLEIRTANAFNFVPKSNSPDYWAKLAESALDKRESWKTAVPPRLNA